MKTLEILYQKICHDLSGQLGAVSTSYDLLGAKGLKNFNSKPVLDLLKDSSGRIKKLTDLFLFLYSPDRLDYSLDSAKIKNWLEFKKISVADVNLAFKSPEKSVPEFLKASFVLLCGILKRSLNDFSYIGAVFREKSMSVTISGFKGEGEYEGSAILFNGLGGKNPEIDVYNFDAYFLLEQIDARGYVFSASKKPDIWEFEISPK